MIAICEHNDETLKNYNDALTELKIKLIARGYMEPEQDLPKIAVCSKYGKVDQGYASCTYRGKLEEDLVDLTTLQVAMICNGGFSWGGGECKKSELDFYVKVLTD